MSVKYWLSSPQFFWDLKDELFRFRLTRKITRNSKFSCKLSEQDSKISDIMNLENMRWIQEIFPITEWERTFGRAICANGEGERECGPFCFVHRGTEVNTRGDHRTWK